MVCLVVKTRLQSLNKGSSEETYSGVVDCIRLVFPSLHPLPHLLHAVLMMHSFTSSQQDHAEGGTLGLPEGGGLPSPGHRAALWHRAGHVLCRRGRIHRGQLAARPAVAVSSPATSSLLCIAASPAAEPSAATYQQFTSFGNV